MCNPSPSSKFFQWISNGTFCFQNSNFCFLLSLSEVITNQGKELLHITFCNIIDFYFARGLQHRKRISKIMHYHWDSSDYQKHLIETFKHWEILYGRKRIMKIFKRLETPCETYSKWEASYEHIETIINTIWTNPNTLKHLMSTQKVY